MVALSDSMISAENPLRVRAQNHTCVFGSEICSNPRRQSNLRRLIYGDCDQLESCSRDPIGYYDGWNTFNYVRNRPAVVVDPHGLEGNALIGRDNHTHPASSPYCGINFYEKNFWSNDRVWLMDHLGFDWRVECDGSKATIWTPMLDWDISWRPKWLTWGFGGYSHRIDVDSVSEIEDFECAYSCDDETQKGNRVKLKANLKWVLYEWWGAGSVPRTPIDFPPFVAGSKETELWSIELTAECECCPVPKNPIPETCSSGRCEG